MKKLFLICLLCMPILFMTGCPDLQKFAASVDQANATWVDASDDLQKIAGEVKDALGLYQEALASGDTDAITKAKFVLEDAQARYERQEEALEVAKGAVENTIKQYEDAKEEQNYWWTIPSLILGGITGALGIRTKFAPAVSALTKTVNNIKDVTSTDTLNALKDKQAKQLTPREKKAVAAALAK